MAMRVGHERRVGGRTARWLAWGMVAASVAGAVALAAGASEPVAAGQADADVQQQIRELREEVRQLRAAQAAQPAYTQRDVENAVDAISRDAEGRSNLLAQSGEFTAGYVDDKFTIRSADGKFSMSPGIWLQIRSVTNWRDGGKHDGKDNNTDNGFEIRRMKFILDGNAFSPDLTYKFCWASDRKTGDLVLEEAWVKYRLSKQWAVLVGQYWECTYQEDSVSSRRKMAVSESIVGQALFGGDTFTQGIELSYADGPLKAWWAVTDGYQSANSNFQDPGSSENKFDFGTHGRVAYKVFGDWKSYADFSAMGNKQDLLVIGAGYDWSQGGDTNVVRHAFDVQYEVGRWGLFASYAGRYTTAAKDSWDIGAVFQAGYLLTDKFEVYGRYAFLHMDNLAAGKVDDFHEFTVGFNYFLHGHALKFTADVGYLPNGLSQSCDGIDVLASDGKDEVYIRAQLQFLL